MPLYTFKCPKCNYEKEVIQKMDDRPPLCKKCKKVKMEKVWSLNTSRLISGKGMSVEDCKDWNNMQTDSDFHNVVERMWEKETGQKVGSRKKK